MMASRLHREHRPLNLWWPGAVRDGLIWPLTDTDRAAEVAAIERIGYDRYDEGLTRRRYDGLAEVIPERRASVIAGIVSDAALD